MAEYLCLFPRHAKYDEYLKKGDVSLPNVSCCSYEDDTHYFSEDTSSWVVIDETTDASGNTIVSETTVNVDENGNTTINKVSTKTDPSGNEIGYETEYTDAEKNVNTQVVEIDESGNEVVTSYVIDTTNNTTTNGEDLSGGEGLDTGFVPFDGSNGFILDVAFHALYSEQPTKPLVPDPYDTTLF